MMFRLNFVIAAMAAMLMGMGAANAVPIPGVTYTYVDPIAPFNGFAPDAGGQLTDGVFGSIVPDVAIDPLAAFRNGTWVGFTQNGADNPQPGVDLDLGGTFQVQSVEIEFLIEPTPAIFTPQPPAGGDALTILDGTTVLGTFNAFPAIDFGASRSIFTAVVNLGGVSLSNLSIDVRSPFDHIFVSEITVNVPEPGTIALLGLGLVGLVGLRRQRDA